MVGVDPVLGFQIHCPRTPLYYFVKSIVYPQDIDDLKTKTLAAFTKITQETLNFR
jgi:hypothetical protein